MARITTTVLLILLLLNGTVTIMEGSGLTDDLGVELAPGVSDAMDDVVTNARQGFSPSGGFGQTLFSLFVAAMGVFRVVIEGVYAAPQMFQNLGFPEYIVVPLFAPMYVVSTLELVSIAVGRRTV